MMWVIIFLVLVWLSGFMGYLGIMYYEFDRITVGDCVVAAFVGLGGPVFPLVAGIVLLAEKMNRIILIKRKQK